MEPAEHRADGLLAQHKLLLAIIATDWATRLDHKIAAILVERYYSKHQNARASLRFLAEAVHADRSNVIDSVRRLVARGPFWIVREGAGTRPTEYGLNFDFALSGGAATTSISGGAEATSSGGADATARASSGGAATTEFDLPSPADKPADGKGRTLNSDARPRGDGLPATPVGGAEDFEKLWDAYGVKLERAKARAAFDKIAPSPEQLAEMMGAAHRWREGYFAQSRPAGYRKRLATWLVDECWLEMVPSPFRPRKVHGVKLRVSRCASCPFPSGSPLAVRSAWRLTMRRSAPTNAARLCSSLRSTARSSMLFSPSRRAPKT